ncbi:MAG: DinB family protein [Gemmatimonadaceae bacterium]
MRSGEVRIAEYRDTLLRTNREVITRIRAAVGGIPEEALHRQPPAGGWGMAEVLEHLTVSADSYLDLVRPVVNGKNGATAPPAATWKPSLTRSPCWWYTPSGTRVRSRG